ncbi:MAG: hypothetical protein QOI69_281, partial [Pseudonocardiales bacterium]|nr:hypothetical protein [Pseudonocardiales bacterium]
MRAPVSWVAEHVDLTPPDRLAVLLWLILEGQHLAHDDRPGQAIGGGVDTLDLEPDTDQSV